MLSLRFKVSIFCYSGNKYPLSSAENNPPVLLHGGHDLFCGHAQSTVVLVGHGIIGLVVVLWWSLRAFWYCDCDCVKCLVSARMSSGQIEMQQVICSVGGTLDKAKLKFWR